MFRTYLMMFCGSHLLFLTLATAVFAIFHAEHNNYDKKRTEIMEFKQRDENGCGDWIGVARPDFDNVTVGCNMKIMAGSVEKFVYTVLKNKYRFVHLYLRFYGGGKAEYTKCIIEPQHWVWTFSSPAGATQYLYWPPEYSVWSMGLLTADSLMDPPSTLDIIVNSTYNNCSVTIGEKDTTERIGKALSVLSKQLTLAVARQNSGNSSQQVKPHVYDTSHYCVKTRTYIASHALYIICLHTICPLEATGYICCHMKWNYTMEKNTVVCSGKTYTYDKMWWIVPFMIGIVAFAYFPLVILWCAAEIQRELLPGKTVKGTDELTPLLVGVSGEEEEEEEEDEWLFMNPMSVYMVLASPLKFVGQHFSICLSRTLRFIAPFLSMLVIVVKVVVHHIYQNNFVVDSVRQGTPMDFLSVLAGYEISKKNFLRSLGGPYVASGVYLFAMVLFLCIPRDLPALLVSGLPSYSRESYSPLFLNIDVQHRLGSWNKHKHLTGYRLIYETMTCRFFMLLNIDFWKYVIVTQSDRFVTKIYAMSSGDNVIKYLLFGLLMPIYIVFCLCETVLCLLCYGLPMTFLTIIFMKSYSIAVWKILKKLSPCFRMPFLVMLPVMVVLMLFVVYMFSVIFVASFIFISRIVVFTYTGLFAYPNFSYGYIIFSVTIAMYILETEKNVREVYRKLFSEVTDLCKEYQETVHTSVTVFRTVDRVSYIPRPLYMVIVNRYKPLRIEMLKAMFKMGSLVLVLFISVYIIYMFQQFKNLSILTQSVTTLFVCLLPKLLKGACSKDHTVVDNKWRNEILYKISEYCSKKEHERGIQ